MWAVIRGWFCVWGWVGLLGVLGVWKFLSIGCIRWIWVSVICGFAGCCG